MNREETVRILEGISGAYPNFLKSVSEKELSHMADMWASVFTDDPFELVAAGTKAFITADTKGFAPVPGQIKAKMQLIQNPNEITEMEAWGLVHKAIRSGESTGHGISCRKAWEELPEDIKNIVSSGELSQWAVTDSSQMSVISSNFMRSYTARMTQKKEYEKLPLDVRAVIENNTKALEGEENESI
jgi:Loader and inhibitor of phage G40P.